MDWQTIWQWLGYPAVALSIGLESLGIPIPGEIILLIAAAAGGAGTGKISWVIVAAVAGVIVGDNLAFLLGRRYGRTLVTRLPLLSEEKLARSETFFQKYGARSFVVARFLPAIRTAIAYLAGINRIPRRSFFLSSALSGILWATVIGGLGYLAGANLHNVEASLRRIGGLWAALLLIGGALLWLNIAWHDGEKRFRLGRIGTAWIWFRSAWRRLAALGQRGLALYLLLLVVGGWATGVWLDDWVQREPELYRRDQLATVWLKLGSAEASPWALALAWLGDPRVLAVVSGLTAVWLWRHKHRRRSLLTVASFGGALALGWALQVALKRPLPSAIEPFWHLTPFSFPYLPALLSVTTYGWLAHNWHRDSPWSEKVNGATVAVFLIIAVGLAGLYLGHAHLSDVLAGLSLGFLWLGIPLGYASTEVRGLGTRVRQRAQGLAPRQRLYLLLAFALPVLILTLVEPPIAQSPSYHEFADQRSFWGVPHFLNVVSNAPFLFVGVPALWVLWRFRRQGGWPAFEALVEQRPYLILFSAVAITCFGSAYYHLAPDNAHLVWDRLPMTFGFMSLFSAVIMERIDRDAGLCLLGPLVVAGIASVVYWYWSELHLRGDLRFYADVQYYPMMAIPLLTLLFPSRYTEGRQIFTIMLLYALAKAFELLDKPVYQALGRTISGHTLKHLLAALATYWILCMILQRRPLRQAAQS